MFFGKFRLQNCNLKIEPYRKVGFIFLNKSYLKTMKNSTLKAIFVLKKFKFS